MQEVAIPVYGRDTHVRKVALNQLYLFGHSLIYYSGPGRPWRTQPFQPAGGQNPGYLGLDTGLERWSL